MIPPALMLLGLLMFVFGLVLAICRIPDGPQNTDKRVVRYGQRFEIEMYSSQPGWHRFSGPFNTAEEAKAFIADFTLKTEVIE